MASSTSSVSVSLASSSSAPQSKHDVFLSFRGRETRKGIISYLFSELQNRGIKTFMDDQDLEPGTEISSNLLTAIKESRSAIVVLSPDYASSTWCLDELAKIVECLEARNTIVLPIFYNVEPHDVRYQGGSFAEAFTKHQQRFTKDDGIKKVKQWRDALTKVAALSGLDSSKYGSDRELVQGIVEHVCSKIRPISIISSGDFEAFEATRRAMDELIKALENNEVAAIGVYGMGGVGKTTMVKHVGAQAQKNGLFHHVIMAVVSQTPDFRTIQGTFADKLGFKFVEETETGRADRLMEKIKSGNKILIILDDIWDRIDLSCIGIPSYNELQRCNSKVLLTTRRLHVCHTMESQANIPLNILSEEDAWNLFVKKARKSFEDDFYDVARKVARECAGLPLALIAVSRALGDKDFGEWKEAARQLEMSQRANLDEKDVFKCIKLSYDYLDDNDAKFCFLLCCLFPEDYDIKIEDLLKYGFGTGLFRDVNNTIENARVKANLVTRYLKDSCLLLDGTKDGCVRMHDVIRDVAMSIALSVDGHASLVKTRCETKDWPMDAYEAYSAISLMESNICKLPNELVCPKLRVLLLQRNASIFEIPKTFFRSLSDLRVLDLSGTSISSLPPSFGLLTNLHALHLDYWRYIIDISILKKLKKLEILSMRHCLIKKFPKEIGNLTNLRMLDFTGTKVERVPSQVISRLHRLEELYIQCNFADWGSEVEGGLSRFLRFKNAGFDEFTALSSLKILQVFLSGAKFLPQNVQFYPNWVNFDICISRSELPRLIRLRSLEDDRYHFRHQHSRSLTLDLTINTLPDWFINVVTKKAEELRYNGCEGLSNIIEEHDRGRLHGLKYLFVCDRQCQYNLKVLMNTIIWPRESNEPVFEKLEELHIDYVYSLEELCVGELPPWSLHNLKTLIVQYCSQLVKPLLPSKLLHRLHNLEKIDCSYMDSMEYVFGFERHEPQQIILTKLRVIVLRYVYDLISIWNGPAPPGIFQGLKKICVLGCSSKLKYLFTSDVARCLLQLEHLWAEDCFSLDRIIETRDDIYIWGNKIVLPKLKNIVLIRLPELTRLSSSGSGTYFGIECPSLEHLYVDQCPQFSLSASDFHCSNQVQLNDQQHLDILQKMWH